jgi:tight adherence protein C
MTAVLAAFAALLCLGALRELGASLEARRGGVAGRVFDPLGAERARTLAGAAIRLGVPRRLVRAGVAEQLSVGTVLAAKAICALAAVPFGLMLAPVAPGRLSLLVATGLPAAAFLAPDAWLERRARIRARRLVGALPDALDLLAVGAASGRNPTAAMAEIAATQDGPLARELGVTVAELGCGASQSGALSSLRERAPGAELASLVAVIERSARYGSPLTDQLRGQATTLRGDQRRRVEEQAARAAPKIQLAVALLLVPSVLLMIAAALIANADVLTAGF